MALVTVSGVYNADNFNTIFEVAKKAKVEIGDTTSILDEGCFSCTAQITGSWANMPKFFKLLAKTIENRKYCAVSTIDMNDPTAEAQLALSLVGYTEYTITMEVHGDKKANKFYNFISYLTSVGGVVYRTNIEKRVTILTKSQVLIGTIMVALPGNYSKSQALLDELQLIADESDTSYCINVTNI